MAASRRRKSRQSPAPDPEPIGEPDADDVSGRVPDLLRRMLGLGLAGFFSTEETLRRALGDTVPRDWVEFASSQGERTRREFAERLAVELGRSVRALDLEQLLERLLDGYTVEVNARVRLVPRSAAERRGGSGDARAEEET